jgi:hypothetical protein
VLSKRGQIVDFIAQSRLEKEYYKRVDIEDELFKKDWLTFSNTYRILAPFYEQTIYLQLRVKTASRKFLWEAFFSMEYFLSHIILAKEEVFFDFPILKEDSDDEVIVNNRKYIRIYFNNCYGKLDHYYILINEIPAYAAIMIFDPAKR